VLALNLAPSRPLRDYAALAGAFTTALASFGVIYLRQPDAYEALVLVAFGAVCSLIVATDIRTLRAPNTITYSSLGCALLLAAPLGGSAVAQALGGAAASFLVLLAVALAGRGAMGMGDVKAGTMCGAVVGLNSVPLMLLSGFFAGGIFAAAALAARLRNRKDVVAFTPFLVLGAMIALALGNGYLVR